MLRSPNGGKQVVEAVRLPVGVGSGLHSGSQVGTPRNVQVRDLSHGEVGNSLCLNVTPRK